MCQQCKSTTTLQTTFILRPHPNFKKQNACKCACTHRHLDLQCCQHWPTLNSCPTRIMHPVGSKNSSAWLAGHLLGGCDDSCCGGGEDAPGIMDASLPALLVSWLLPVGDSREGGLLPLPVSMGGSGSPL